MQGDPSPGMPMREMPKFINKKKGLLCRVELFSLPRLNGTDTAVGDSTEKFQAAISVIEVAGRGS